MSDINGLYLHFSNKNAKLIPHKNMFGISGFNFFNGVLLYKFLAVINIKKDKVFYIFLIDKLNIFLGSLLKSKKNYIKYKTNINITNNITNAYVNAVFIFNIFTILLNLIENLVNKLCVYIKRIRKKASINLMKQ